MELFGQTGRKRYLFHPVEAFCFGQKRIYGLPFFRTRCERQFERIEQRIFIERLFELRAEQLAEFGVFYLFLFRYECHHADEFVGRKTLGEAVALFGCQPVAEFDGHGDALFERVGHHHRHEHQIAYRSQQKKHERHADGRDDVGIAYFALQSGIVFHGVLFAVAWQR